MKTQLHHSNSSKRATTYFDIDMILAEEERMILVVDKGEGAFGLGFLSVSNSNHSTHLESGSKVDLPLWLVQDLKDAFPDRKLFIPRLPSCFQESSLIYMEAHARSLDLKANSNYFFEFGLMVQKMLPQATLSLNHAMAKIVSYRMCDILDTAQTSDDVSEYVSKLTCQEFRLYSRASQRSRELTNWKQGQTSKLEGFSSKRLKL